MSRFKVLLKWRLSIKYLVHFFRGFSLEHHGVMSILFHILAASLLTRTAAIGIAALLSCRWLAGLSEQLLAVACGLLTAIALTHLIPEAMEMPGVEPHDLGLVMLGTIFVFLVIERCVLHHSHTQGTKREDKATATAVMTGAALHNVVDGVLIASTFMMDERAGWLVAFAVCSHEIPQVTGYMVILRNCGFTVRRAVLWCALAAFAAILGSVLGWAAVSLSREILPYALAASAASFLFITLHALLPEVFRDHASPRQGARQLVLFALGILLSTVILGLGHGHDHGGHDQTSTVEEAVRTEISVDAHMH